MILITFPKAETHIKQENLQFHFGRICPYENFLGGKVGHASSIRFCCRTCLIILYYSKYYKGQCLVLCSSENCMGVSNIHICCALTN